ncbi:hypothetical protein AGR56_17845 [Clostridium sp. DMHC 10]|uniref:hypothetical protein n=1 Tax=Clostridium sp. DMHC 10 TaxID=747377 RepID=UPI00069DCA3F|nr:hypothetical protein [Clostridium sp. DMHC 10]KOF55702.1 hypothetical protein AGR56_17845 [Clostridium sp. DMHC 10]
MKTEQIERMNKINELIEVIASVDRRFFYSKSKDRTGKFIEGKKLFYIDEYTGEKVYPYYSGRKKFSHGGTLWGLVNDFREWIITGKLSNGNNGYGGLYCPHWGYTAEGMAKVVTKGKEIGFLKKDAPRYEDVLKQYKARGLA